MKSLVLFAEKQHTGSMLIPLSASLCKMQFQTKRSFTVIRKNEKRRGGTCAHQLNFNNQPIHLSVSLLVIHISINSYSAQKLPMSEQRVSGHFHRQVLKKTNIHLQDIIPSVSYKYVRARALWPRTNRSLGLFKQTC